MYGVCNDERFGRVFDYTFLDALRDSGEVKEVIEGYIGFYNSKRPCFALGYKTPDAFFEEFMEGKVERKDTFRNRVLDPTPKFVREKLAAAEEMAQNNGGIGSSNLFADGGRVHQPGGNACLASTNEGANPCLVSTCA